MPKLQSKALEILVVEDNPGDVLLLREILQEAKTHSRVSAVEDGEEALRYLRGADGGRLCRRPDLILLDLNLPRKHGCEVLAEIKQDETLRRIPVIVLSSSSDEQDIRRSYELHANCYITKPVNLNDFIHVVEMLEQFWLKLVKLPEN